jgi:hypothetical protein
MFLTFRISEANTVQVNPDLVTHIVHDTHSTPHRVVFHFTGGGAWELPRPTAEHLRQLDTKFGNTVAGERRVKFRR